MAVKSIIDIDVNDSAFKEFQEAFAKYQAQVAKQPEIWRKIGKGAQDVAGSFQGAATEAGVLKVHVENIADLQEKLQRGSRSTERSFNGLVKSSSQIARNIGGATASLLKWSGIVGLLGGVVGAGGLFGISRLAASTSGTSKAARGLGVSYGQLEGAQLEYGRALANPTDTLTNIRNSQSDLSQRWIFSNLGVNADGKNAAQLMPDVMRAARDRFKQGGGTLQEANAQGLTNIFGYDDLVRMKQMSDAEFNAMLKKAQEDEKQLELSRKTQAAWQDLDVQLQRAEKQIKVALVEGLVPLAGPLKDLSKAVAEALRSFLATKELKGWIHDLGEGIKEFAKYLGSDQAKQNLISLMDGIDAAAGAFMSFAKSLGKLFGAEKTLKGSEYRKLDAIAKTDPKMAKALQDYLENPSKQKYNGALLQRWVELHPGLNLQRKDFAATQQAILQRFGFGADNQAVPTAGTVNQPQGGYRNGAGGSLHNPGNIRSWGKLPRVGGFAQFPDEASGIRAMAQQLRLYKQRGIDTIGGIVNKYAPAGDGNKVAAYIRDVVNRTGYAADQHLNTSDSGVLSKLIAAMTKHENSNSTYTPGTVITILNNTGGNAIVSAAQLAH